VGEIRRSSALPIAAQACGASIRAFDALGIVPDLCGASDLEPSSLRLDPASRRHPRKPSAPDALRRHPENRA